METILGEQYAQLSSISSGEQVSILAGPPMIAPRPIPFTMMSTQSIEAAGIEMLSLNKAAFGTGNNWPSANLAVFVPWLLAVPWTARQMFWFNGSAVAGNLDIGIYDSTGTRKVSKGTTAQATTNTMQIADITDTLLTPGLYYLSMSSDTSGVTQKVGSVTLAQAAFGSVCGIFQAATAFVLPSSVTFASYAQTVVPLIGVTGSASI